MQLHRGEVVALLGPNGSGKTTCFYMIIGLVAQDRGSITIDGAPGMFLDFGPTWNTDQLLLFWSTKPDTIS